MSWFHRDDAEEPWHRLVKDHNPIQTVDEDSGEVIDIKPEQDGPNDVDGLLVKFDYCDDAGQATTRIVLCHRCWAANDFIYVQGFCTLRQALRTFRTERMSNLSEVRTRKKVTDPTKYFGHYLDTPPPKWQHSPVTITMPIVRVPISHKDEEARVLFWHRRHEARRACVDGLRVLAYVALSGEGWTASDLNIEESYVEARLAMAGLQHSQEMTDAMLAIGAGLAVPFSSYIRAVNFIAPDESHF